MKKVFANKMINGMSFLKGPVYKCKITYCETNPRLTVKRLSNEGVIHCNPVFIFDLHWFCLKGKSPSLFIDMIYLYVPYRV